MSTPAPVALTLADLDPTQPLITKPGNASATLEADPWQVLDAEGAQAWCQSSLDPKEIKNAADITPTLITPTLLPLATWLAYQPALQPLAQAGRVGVWLSPEEAQEAQPVPQASLAVLPVVAFFFPLAKFGQPYSAAVLLRTRFGYQGHIRALGDVGRDQLFYLARCGFTQFKLKPGKNATDALASFADFTTPYQTSADGLLPIFARRGVRTV